MPVVIYLFDTLLLQCGSTIYNVLHQFKQLIHYTLREVHTDMSVVLLEPFLERVHVSNVGFRCLRLANLIELIEVPLLFLVLLDLLLYLAKFVLDEALALVIVKGCHAT